MTNVLLADDNEALRQTSALILKRYGYQVSEAKDGEEALEIVSEDGIAVMVLDVKMPKVDGVGVVEALDQEGEIPVVVMISAYEFDEGLKKRLGSRVFSYFRKPLAPKDLIFAVTSAAKRAEAIQGV